MKRANGPELEWVASLARGRSTIVTGQIPVKGWHAIIGDPTYADTIFDRLDLAGDSLRKLAQRPRSRQTINAGKKPVSAAIPDGRHPIGMEAISSETAGWAARLPFAGKSDYSAAA